MRDNNRYKNNGSFGLLAFCCFNSIFWEISKTSLSKYNHIISQIFEDTICNSGSVPRLTMYNIFLIFVQDLFMLNYK